MDYSALEDFQCTLREVILKAEKLKRVVFPDAPAVMPLRVVIDLLSSMAPLEAALTKARDVIQFAADTAEEVEGLFHLGQVIS